MQNPPRVLRYKCGVGKHPKKGEIKVGVWELWISPYSTYAGSGFCVFHVLIVATDVYKELVIYVLSTLKQGQKK